jgi:acetyl-CoA synthetase
VVYRARFVDPTHIEIIAMTKPQSYTVPYRHSLCTPEQFEQMYRHSLEDPETFWAEMARSTIDWFSPWTKTMDCDFPRASIRWFTDATLNVSHNCLDRHLDRRGDQTAIIWEGNEPGDVRRLTYRELHREVCRAANMLKSLGVKQGDRVALYMPMVPELAIAMLACARIGAIHSVVFAGFSKRSLQARILDAQCSVVITANEGVRGPKKIPLKEICDLAVEGVKCVRSVVVLRRTDTQCEMVQGRDLWWHELMEQSSDECPALPLDSEHPLFILYTSGSTGAPKGVVHTQGGYLLYVALTHRYVFDYREGDIFFCAADCGWVTGHSYVVYGPLANGATTVMFESVPHYPDPGRYWDTVERHRVNIFYTAPTAIRAIAKESSDYVTRYDRSSLRVLGTVGEPINEDAWLWYFETVGDRRCPVVDTWWQTETGGTLMTPLPGITEMKPGLAMRPFFGVKPTLVDDDGHEITGNDVKGKLCLEGSWPGQMRGVFGDPDRFYNTYFTQFPGRYFTGDSCYRDSDGHYRIIGRVDDVLNVAGHRIGTAEVESALVSSGVVAEAAVVGVPHEVKGTAIFAFCILQNGVEESGVTLERIRDAVRHAIGAFAVPDAIAVVPGLPKTRSGKIMRRILRALATGEEGTLGDTSTLSEPGVVDQIRAALHRR